jgi:hypothetical protein
LEGFDAANSIGSVISLYSSSQGSSNVTFRRVCAWNAGGSGTGGNAHVWDVSYSADVLVEDSCGFGTGRNTVIAFASNRVTFRRVWARHEGYDSNTGPKVTFQLLYYSDNVLCENCLGTWTYERVANCNNLGVEPVIIKWGGDTNTLTRVMGSIAYQKALATCNPLSGGVGNPDGQPLGKSIHAALADVVSYLPISGLRPFNFVNIDSGTATRITAIKAATASTIGNTWTVSPSLGESATVAGTGFDFQGGSNSAKLCFRYTDGTIGTTPLWPWPMDGRIKAALGKAGSSALGGTDRNVTSEIESILGTIPAACRQ